MMHASEPGVKRARTGYNVGTYFTVSIVLIILFWSVLSEVRWMLFDSGAGERYHYDTWIVLVLMALTVGIVFSYFALSQSTRSMSKECTLLGGSFHAEERHLVAWWSILIGMVLGMGFWDIVTMIHLAIVYGILNIWLIDVTVLDFGFWQMVFPVWALVIIGILKMGAVIMLYALVLKNVRRGSTCDLASFSKGAIMD